MLGNGSAVLFALLFVISTTLTMGHKIEAAQTSQSHRSKVPPLVHLFSRAGGSPSNKNRKFNKSTRLLGIPANKKADDPLSSAQEESVLDEGESGDDTNIGEDLLESEDDESASARDEEEEEFNNVFPSLVSLFGAIFSLYALVIERYQWNPQAFQRFSITTKIPVEIFCLSGPLVFVSALLYTIMTGLWLTDEGTTSIFFISVSWSAIIIDMSFVCYSNVVKEIVSNRTDLVLHIVNLLTVYLAFKRLRFFPITFVLCGLSFWGIVIAMRVFRRVRNGEPVREAIFRPGSP